MIGQILSHTPIYVWALLAFLVYRGFLASQDCYLSLTKMAVIPVVMLVLALTSINTRSVLGEAAWAAWGAGAALAVVLILTRSKSDIVIDRANGAIFQRGSWAPLALMLAIFLTKYMVGVLSVMQPQLVNGLPFALGVSTLYGLFNGIFIGRLARNAAAWLRQPAAVAAL